MCPLWMNSLIKKQQQRSTGVYHGSLAGLGEKRFAHAPGADWDGTEGGEALGMETGVEVRKKLCTWDG